MPVTRQSYPSQVLILNIYKVMKKIKLIGKISFGLMILGLSLTACDEAEQEVGMETLVQYVSMGDDGSTIIDEEILKVGFPSTSGDLSEEVADWLQFMREEEKLARDLYIAFDGLYNYRIFQNISKAEQNHMDLILSYLEIYELDDPAAAEAGVFNNEDLQNLYNDLFEKGSVSLIEALKVGALVEEVDIIDLAEVYEMEPGEDIIAVTEALMLGSRNHLRAFNRTLGFQDIDYEPVLMSLEDFEEIINSSWERGTGLCRNIDVENGNSFGYARGRGFCRGGFGSGN